MGMCSDNRSIRVKTREAMRGAMLAAAHMFTYVERTAIRANTEQYRYGGTSTCTLTEKASQPCQGSEMLLGVPVRRMTMSHPCADKTGDSMCICTEGFGANRGDRERKAFECRSPQPRMESDMVARSVCDEPRKSTSSHGKMMQIFVKGMTGQTITLEVETENTIENVKDAIAKRLGVQSLEHRLTKAGKSLQAEYKTIREAGIHRHETLTMCGRLHGGVTREISGVEIEQSLETREAREKEAIDWWYKIYSLQPIFTTDIMMTATRMMAMESGEIADVIK